MYVLHGLAGRWGSELSPVGNRDTVGNIGTKSEMRIRDTSKGKQLDIGTYRDI